jgi:tetratricopeptide (TPR) repeat protein
MWNEVAQQNIRAFNIAKDLWKPGDVPGDMAHSGDWGQYGFLQLGDYAGAFGRIKAFEEMAETTKHARATSALSLVKARYIVESEEWKLQPVVESASPATLFANGMSAVNLLDMATAEKMVTWLGAKVRSTPSGEGATGAHADHAAPAGSPPAAPAAATPAAGIPESGKSTWIMHRELSALVSDAKGQRDAAIATLREAVKVEESMRPPNGAAEPIKPSHELLGELLLRAGQHLDAAAAFDACLLRMPNRARSLYGSAVAHAALGHRALAEERWASLQSFWKGRPFSPLVFK